MKTNDITIDDLNNKGVEIFGNIDNFNSWMYCESYGLNYEQPIEIIKKNGGK